MNIKSLLLGSAAALAVVSGAQAADAIVAAEPEPMEYVRVCDAFGTGYFYIPGTETCLKIGGEVRATAAFGNDAAIAYGARDENWQTDVRARVSFDAKNDSELGTIGSRIRIQAEQGSASTRAGVVLDEAYITVGGFKVGRAYAFWDDVGIAGENDAFTGNARFNLISYTYSSDAFTAGLGVHDLTSNSGAGEEELGIEAMASASLGVATLSVYGVYDFGFEEGAISGKVSAEVGPGTFELYAAYSSGANTYVGEVDFPVAGITDSIEWTVGGAYAFKATDKLTITPSVNYWEFQGGTDAWGAGLLAEYALASGLTAAATVDYFDADGEDDAWTGFVRLTRSF
ncbi:MAG: porin [Allorhizobium sp.]|uniref:porin n=1 Tax=Allorhizobium sp. TaxID=633478 RepID=UPI00403470D2